MRPFECHAAAPVNPRLPGRSSPVRSSQPSVHPRLAEVVRRHLDQPWRAPLHEPTRQAFERLCALLAGEGAFEPVLDSGCGDGRGTRRIGALHPDCLVIGVDRSAARLGRGGHSAEPHREGNCVWLRGELGTFWRLAGQAGWRLRRHYLLYPNPWPKPGHLLRRWHAHPAFPALLALGGELDLRCNWRLYAEEFAMALGLATGERPGVAEWRGEAPLTSFETKYRNSGHALFRVRAAVKNEPRLPGAQVTATEVHSS